MALNTIQSLIQKKGEDYVKDLLENEVIITEKLDTYRFVFQKEGDYIRFYKKNSQPINLVERTLTDVWEDAISELPQFLAEKEIPENLTFGITYTPVERPVRLPYENVSKYILSDVTKRNKGKVVNAYDYSQVNEWAQYFNIGKPPIIFEGKLNDKQKKTLLNYGKNEFDWDENNFTESIEKLFGNTYSNSDLIEGIIIKGYDGQLIKMTAYEFDILNEAYNNINHSKDFYDLTIISLNQLMENYKIPYLESETEDERYIEVICDIFNNFCEENTINEQNFNTKYLTPPSYGYLGNLNRQFIKNPKTLEYLDQNPLYESIFKVILSAFRKKKKPSGLLNENSVRTFNSHVYLINSIASGNVNEQESISTEDINEDNINEERSDNVVVNKLNQYQRSDVDEMKVVSTIQKAFDPKIEDPDSVRGEKECAIYITDCNPMSSDNLENIKKISEEWNVPVIIGTISDEKMMEGDDFQLSDEIKISQLQFLQQYHPDLIEKYMITKTWDLSEIFELCRPDYEPIVLITDNKKKSDYLLQLYFEEEVMGKRISVKDEFDIGEMNTEDSIYAFRAIEDADGYDFKNYTPKAIWNLFNTMVSEYKTWSGQVINSRLQH